MRTTLTFLDTKVVVDDLGHGRETVGGARRVGDDPHGRVVGRLVDAHDEHGRVGRGRGDDDPLGAGGEVGGRLLVAEVHARRLDDVGGAWKCESKNEKNLVYMYMGTGPHRKE